jgi:two-component system, OmpR family, alkaline phosphatase synthesis response regulator PhoP
MLIRILGEAGFEAECAENAVATIELAKSKRFDLYLIDSWLPDVSGITLCEQLRAFDQATPILFYSGAGSKRDIEQAFMLGAQGYLIKPVECERLVAEVSRLIEESKSANC